MLNHSFYWTPPRPIRVITGWTADDEELLGLLRKIKPEITMTADPYGNSVAFSDGSTLLAEVAVGHPITVEPELPFDALPEVLPYPEEWTA